MIPKIFGPHPGRLFAAFGLVLAFALADAVVSYRMTLRLIENERWVTHTHEVLNELEGTLTALKDADRSSRDRFVSELNKTEDAINAAQTYLPTRSGIFVPR